MDYQHIIESRSKNSGIAVKEATLWRCEGKDELSIEFTIPNEQSRKYTTLSDEQAATRYARIISDLGGPLRAFTPEDQEFCLNASAAREAEAISGYHIDSGVDVLKRKILAHLHSAGYPARGGGEYSPYHNGTHGYYVRMVVDDAPEKILSLAEMCNDEGVLNQRVLLSDLKSTRNINTSAPSVNEFRIELNKAVFGPSSEKSANSR